MEIDRFISNLYKNRFSQEELKQKNKIWKALCRHFFQRHIDDEAVVLDLGAGYGEFINNIRCKEKIAVDLNEDVREFFSSDVKFFKSQPDDLSFLSENKVDVVFMSNFCEHFRNKEQFIKTLSEVRRVLKPQGKLIILGPNIRYVYKEYWDFFDHHIPLSAKGVSEVLRALDFKVEKTIDRFLPYTTKSKIPKNTFAVIAYLKLPIIWKILGGQMFILARKPR